MRAVTFIACGYATALWIAATLFGLSDDVLFFHSDLLSKIYFLAALAFLLLPAVLIAIGAATAVLRRHRALRVAAAIPLVLLLAGFLYAGGELAFGKVESFASYVLIMAGAILLSAVAIWCLPDRGTVLDRAGQLSRIVLFAAVPLTLAAWTFFHLPSAKAGAGAPRHAVMILIDGMPSQLLASYAPGAPTTELDRVARRGCVVPRAYTNRTYTSGYFSVFYNGDYSGTAQRPEAVLPQALERAGDGFRWISFHPNGFPETAHVEGYTGLRSAMLTERWTWLPRLLGLPYHVFLTWNETRPYMGERVNTLYEALNGETAEEPFWRDVLPAQIKEMQERYHRSFLLVHVSVTKHTVQALADGSYGDQAESIQALTSYAVAHDYTYTPDQAPVVEAYRQYYRERINQYGRRIDGILDALKAAGLSDDTLVLVTADHGSTFSNGHLWYGRHAEEDVARVPLMLFGSGVPCQAAPAIDTLDVRATVDSFLDLPREIPEAAHSLLARDSGTTAKTIPVLTVRSDSRKTWYLHVHPAEGVRYLFNLHPDSDGQAVKESVRGYAVEEIPFGSDTAPWQILAEALKRTGIDRASIHAGLRERIENATR
jgi:heme/copper-type cytochrome/quinol oxidase subunit 4